MTLAKDIRFTKGTAMSDPNKNTTNSDEISFHFLAPPADPHDMVRLGSDRLGSARHYSARPGPAQWGTQLNN